MTTPLQVALLGATGKAGAYILQQLLSKGYAVNALIRRPQAFTVAHPLLTVIAGDAQNPDCINLLVQNCTAVISAIGQKSGEPPIAALATKNIINAMCAQGIKRYIAITGLTLDVEGDTKSPVNQAKSVWMRHNYPEAVADKQKAHLLLAGSHLDWTLVRIPTLELTDSRRQLVTDLYDSPGNAVTAGNLAAFTVELLSSGDYMGKAPFVASL